MLSPLSRYAQKSHSRWHFPFYVTLLTVLTAIGLCGKEADALDVFRKTDRKRDFSFTLDQGGTKRVCRVHLPPDFKKDKSAPLVIALHGSAGKARTFDRSMLAGTLTNAADERGMVLVFPQGLRKQWCDGRSETLKSKHVCDDVEFIKQIIKVMVQKYGVDQERVYATGLSNGGFMSLRLALDSSEKFAAVAAIAAQIPIELKDMKPKLPISIMIVNGTQDPLVPYDGGHVRLCKSGRSRGKVLSTTASVEHFCCHNGCNKLVTNEQPKDLDPQDGMFVEVEKYRGGKSGAEVVLVKVVGGGHTWPGGRQYFLQRFVGKVYADMDASAMVLDFFLKHSRTKGEAQVALNQS